MYAVVKANSYISLYLPFMHLLCISQSLQHYFKEYDEYFNHKVSRWLSQQNIGLCQSFQLWVKIPVITSFSLFTSFTVALSFCKMFSSQIW